MALKKNTISKEKYHAFIRNYDEFKPKYLASPFLGLNQSAYIGTTRNAMTERKYNRDLQSYYTTKQNPVNHFRSPVMVENEISRPKMINKRDKYINTSSHTSNVTRTPIVGSEHFKPQTQHIDKFMTKKLTNKYIKK